MATSHSSTAPRSRRSRGRSTDLAHAIHSSSYVLLIESGHSDEETFAALQEAGRPPFWWCDSTEFALPEDLYYRLNALVIQEEAAA
jgi:hypothetical protein